MLSIKLILLTLSTLFFAADTTPLTAHNPTHLIYQFANGTWVENIAVRPNNHLLVTLITTPDLYSLDPDTPSSQPKLIHTFSNATALFGIDEIYPDVFVLIAGNYSLKTGNTAYSYSVWKVDFSSCTHPSELPEISYIAPVPEGIQLNGLCSLPGLPGHVLLSDLAAGSVLCMDISTGATSIAVPSTNSLVSVATHPLYGTGGVDGIHVHDNYLYAANVGRATFGKLRINNDGSPAPGSEPVILQRAGDGENEDDFAIDEKGNSYVVTGTGNTVVKVRPDGSQSVVGGSKESGDLAEPTSCALERVKKGGNGKRRLFVVTGGGLLAPVGGEVVGGQVVSIELD